MRLPLRKLLFWLHLSAAVAVGLVVLLLAATGLILAFESQILAFADRDWREVTAPPSATAPSAEEILAAVAAHQPSLAASAVTIRRDPEAAVVLALGREGLVYVDPHRGAVLGPGSTRARKAMRAVTELHRYLATTGERRPLGKGVTGAANLAFLFILLSGLYLWVPRVLDRARLRAVLWFRRGLASRARDLNWHHVLGFWAWVPLVLIVVSAVPMSYGWAGDLVLRVTGSPPSPKPPQGPASAAATAAPVALAAMDLDGLDRAAARAIAEAPDWRSITLRLPPSPEGKVSVTVEGADRRGRPDLRTQLVVDRATGALIEKEAFADQSLGRRMRSWMRWIHTGEAGGLPGQIVAALACAATLLLGWTGFALALRRLSAWLHRDVVDLSFPATRPARTIPPRRRARDSTRPREPLHEKVDA